MEQEKNHGATTVAWFKLADLIARKEREKALSVYRLLSHSFEDRAYVLQLEGDILWSFDDAEATNRYRQAAFLYRKEHRFVNAIAVCEHLLQLNPCHEELLATLLDLYLSVDWQEPLRERLTMIFDMLAQRTLTHDQGYTILKVFIDRAKKAENDEKRKELYGLLNEYKERIPEVLWVRLESQK